ncbi:hypothetical protein ANANG_G00176050 [Anguilla anguilla]|uniref:Microtubule actin crosslinking factor 1 n=1 Tax=Anguilla anguilla TaxID=7936 RepID=A0A9D3M7N1_ANGAN|nr:hypothetical protein ANANG_G00176050 [Anguilla anguilla]
MWPVFCNESRLNAHLHSRMCCTDERDRVQKKTFTKWVNKHLIKVRKHITDLYEDLRDGHNLISLLEVLSGVALPREKGRMRFHRLQNVQIALDFLKQRQVKLVNIRNDDITDGNPKLTLGLIWTIILHFQISEIYVSGESGDLTAKEKLLLWSQQAIEGYPGTRCVNFSSSWSDGRMFNVLLHRYRPDLIDMEVVGRQSNRDNLEQAFDIAESLGVTRLLDAEVITYVSSIYDAFPKIPEGGEGIPVHEVDQRWAEYQARFPALLQWTRQHTLLMADKNFPQNPVELKALYNEYVHFKETEIPAKEMEKSRIEHLYKMLEVWMEFGRIKLPQGLHPNDLEEEWGKLILEMLEREKALRPAVERLELLLQMANKIQNAALDCEEKLTHAKNTVQAGVLNPENVDSVRCEQELGVYLQDCEGLIRQLQLDLQILRDEKYYQVEQLAFRVSCLQEELVSLRLQCSSVYRKGHFSPGGLAGDQGPCPAQSGAPPLGGRASPCPWGPKVCCWALEETGRGGRVAAQTPHLLGWVEETQDLLEQAEWGADLPSVEQHLQDHRSIHTAVEGLLQSLKEARSYESTISPNFHSSYSETLAKLEHQYCKLLEHSSWRLRCLESLHAFVSRCTEELIWLNEREEEELAFDWSENNTNIAAKRELYADMKSELEEKQEVMHSLQETADRLCQENHPAKQTVEAYSAALQTQWEWVSQLCLCVEQHLKDNTAYFQFVSDVRECESYLRQLQDTIKRQYTCDKNSRLGKLEDLLQDSMEEKEQLIEYRSTVASLVGRAKTVVQLGPRNADCIVATTTPIRAVCDYRQIEITIGKGEECVLEDNTQRTKWKVISPSGNEAMVPSVCFTVPPPNQGALDTASRMEQLYQNVMALWHQLHVNMKSVVSWHYLLKDTRTISSWTLEMVRSQAPLERQQALDNLVLSPDMEKDESVSRSYLTELQDIKRHLVEAEHRLTRGIQTPLPSNLSSDGADNTVHIAEQEEKPSSTSVPVLRSELTNDGPSTYSSVYLHKLKTVDVLMRSSQAAESLLHKYESRLSEEDMVPADSTAIQGLREQLGRWQSDLDDQEHVFQSLSTEVQRARAAGAQLSTLHPDRSPELDRYQEKAAQLTERWAGVRRQIETRRADLDTLGSVLQQYRQGHSALIRWIEETTERQENTQPGQTDSKVLSEQLAQQTALVAEIEQNQVKLDQCQAHSKQYCSAVKDYELQLMTYRAFVESTQKSPVKRRRMHSSSDAITQEFMDLRTRYTALVTLTTQHVKYISDALRRLEEEEKEVEEERQAHVGQVTDLLCWVRGLQDRTRGPTGTLAEDPKSAESSLAAQQAINEQLAAKKEEVAEAIRSTQAFLRSKQASKLSAQERARVASQLEELTDTYGQLCQSSSAQLQQLEQQLAREEERKSQAAIAGVIDLGTVETFPVFQAAQRGLIDQDTCYVLLEAQLTMGGLLFPDSPESFSLDEGISHGLIDSKTAKSLSELEAALRVVDQSHPIDGHLVPVAVAIEEGLIGEEVGLRILELQMSAGGLQEPSCEERLSPESAVGKGLLSPRVYSRLSSRSQRRELIDPNTAEKLSFVELLQRCVLNPESGLWLLPVSQQPGGAICLRSGRKVGIFRAVQEGLIDRQVTVRLLEAQLFAGGIADPRTGHRLTVEEAVRHSVMDQDLACALLTRQLQAGGLLDPVSGERLGVDEAIRRDLLAPRMALLVLESLWAFMGLLWPESGELLPIAEALQQGVISGDLARRILNRRRLIGALYLPETSRVVPLDQAEEVVDTRVVEILRQTEIPDVLPNMNQSGSPTLNRLSWGSASSSPPSSSPPTSPPGLNCDPAFMKGVSPEEKRLKLVDGQSGVGDEKTSIKQVSHEVLSESSAMDMPVIEIEEPKRAPAQVLGGAVQPPVGVRHAEKEVLHKEWRDIKLEEAEPRLLDQRLAQLKQTGAPWADETITDKHTSESTDVEMPLMIVEDDDQATMSPERVHIETSAVQGDTEQKSQTVQLVESGLLDRAELLRTAKQALKVRKQGDNEAEKKGVVLEPNGQVQRDSQRLVKEGHMQHVSSGLSFSQEGDSPEQREEDRELERLAKELQEGGLRTDGGERLLLDEAVSQGILPGHTAVKLMERAGLFGGFLDVSTCEALSVEDVVQEGLLDESLMQSVLQSEKTLAGVVDVEHGKLYSLQDAARVGLLDPETVARLLEAQVVSGGVVDLRRGKKVSVTLASNLGLIDEGQREELATLEKSCRGKSSDPGVVLSKATLQLQMDGMVDPKTRAPVTLMEALQKGLLDREEAQRVLSEQVAEGGIMHHGSGVRLSVADALQRGLVDEGMVQELEYLERAYHDPKLSSTDPSTAFLLASTGSIYDPESGCRLTLSKALSQGLLDKATAESAMASPGVVRGVLDPHSAHIVPYSELINQGKIDIETGQRFLEVHPFRGVRDQQTGRVMTVPQALEVLQVDKVPAMRLLQNQADTGGIVDVCTGDRLSLPEAVTQGQVGESMARLIATNQIQAGGLLDPASGERVPSLREATEAGLITRDMAAALQGNLDTLVEEEEEYDEESTDSEREMLTDGQRDQKRTAAGTVSQQAQGLTEEVKSKGEQTTPPQVGEQQQIEREEMDSAQKVAHGPGEKEVLLMKAKESILRKVFERGVSERQAAEELEALRKVPEGTECLLVPEEEHSGGNIIQKRSEAAETLLEKTMEELRLDIPLSDRTAATQEPQLQESPDSGESQSEETLESDVAESIEEGEEEEEETEGETKEPQAERKKSSRGSKSSLVRQECLEHDQQIMALTSMVRHIQVRLKQQQQQSIGRSLNALDDIISQVEALDLELVDLEPEVKREVEAAAQLLEPCPEEVPPQLLKALEKDQRSLARGYAAAREVAQNALQGLRATRDSKKEAVSAELQSLGQRVEDLLSWLKETESVTETQVDRVTGTDVQTQGQSVRDGTSAQLTQKLQLCKELQSSLSARSGDVGSVALDVQVFISERAQDLAPEQSRQLLGHLQQLQRAFHEAAGRTQARADGLAAQREREEERERREREKEQQEKEREKERENAREREVTQQQKAECSQKLEGLAMWLAGAAGSLANQKAGAGSGDVGVLQQKQRELKEVQRDLQSRGDGVSETVRGVEEFLAEKGNGLSAEERASLQRALSQVREQYGSLTDTTQTSLAQLDTAISATVQQNTQRAKAVEELQETQGKIDTLLKDLSSLQQPGETPQGVMHTDSASSMQPGGAVHSHCDMLQAELQQLQAQQAQLMQVSQSAQSLLLQPDSSVPAEEKQRLRAALDRLRSQHQERLQSCQDRLRRADALRDELAKFLQEHAHLEAWLEQSEQELRSLGEGETDAQGLKQRLEEHKKLGEDVICHKADLRFVSISGQKALDWVQGAREREGGVDPALEETQQLVSDRLQDATQRYATLHSKSSELGTRLSGLLDRYQQYQDEAGSLTSWLTAQEQNQCVVGPSGEQTDTQTLQNTLRAVQLVQDELAERSVQLERVRRAGRDLANAQESPTLRASDISSTADALEGRFGALSASVSARAEQLQTAVAQSVSVQEGLQTLLSWLNGLVLAPGPVLPTAQAVQDALTQNQKLRQELLSRQGSVDTTRDSVSKLLQTADATTASGLQGALQDLSHRYTEAQAKQGEREAELRGLLPRLESYERLSTDLRNFTQSRERALSLGGQPDCSVKDYKQTIEEVKSELNQEEDQLKSLCELGTNLSQSRVFTNTQSLLDTVKEVSEEFARLQSSVNERSNAVQGCGEQLAQFRSLSGALLRWLQATQEQLPSEEAGLSTEALQRRVQQLQELLSDWQAQGARVQELNQTGSELEAQIISITAPYSKTGVSQLNGASSPSSINGIHTCKDLTEIQVALADVNGGYERLGAELRERQGRQASSLELRQRARRDAEALTRWMGDREHTLALGQTASPSKPEAVRAQAQQNKALLSELAEHSGKVEELKSSLQQLIAENPDSPETETWKEQLRDIDSRWEKANQMAAQRQAELETCADRLGSFAAAASQLGPWLREKELMMSVLGPLSIDPNMLNTQKQQVQFMLREFETRRPQFDQLTQAAEGILSPGGEAQDQEEVRAELEAVSGQWGELTRRLSQRSEQIERAQGTSERYQALLRELALSVGALGERLDAQASLSAQPEALRRRLQETPARSAPSWSSGAASWAGPSSSPLRSLEERAEDSMSQLQAALSSTQQFQQMFEELRGWLDEQGGLQRAGGAGDALPCEPGALRTLLERQEELQRGAAQQRGSYDLLQAEGVSLLASLPAGGEERAALQSRLAALRQDWEALNHSAAERHGRLREALSRAELYQQHRAELAPWVEACEGQEGEVQPSLEPAALEEALQKARQLGLDLGAPPPLVEALNAAADTLLEQCRAGEEEVRDEKAGLNRRVDGLSERLQARAAQLEELAGRLREFEEGRQSVERRLESARHQIEVQEALGPQACSNKSLERLRGQQEALLSLQPQVAYLRGLAGGLVQDAPGGAAGDQGASGWSSRPGTWRESLETSARRSSSAAPPWSPACRGGRGAGAGAGRVLPPGGPGRRAGRAEPGGAGRRLAGLAGRGGARFLGQLAALRAELEAHGGDCTAMLRREGSSRTCWPCGGRPRP